MTTIKTTCYQCGDIHLTPDDVFLELEQGKQEGKYWFTCPDCNTRQSRSANQRVVSALLATGVEFDVERESLTLKDIESFEVDLRKANAEDIWQELGDSCEE